MGKAPTGTRKNKKKVYGITIKKPKKTRSYPSPSPSPPLLPPLPRRSLSNRSLSPTNSNNKMITNNNNKPSDNVNNLANMFRKKMPKTRKPRKTITIQPKDLKDLRRSRRGRVPIGTSAIHLRKIIDQSTQLAKEKKSKRKENKEFKKSVNNNLSSLISGFSVGRKSTGRKLKRRNSKRR